MRNLLNRIVVAATLAVVCVTGALAQVTPPDLSDTSEAIRDSIYTSWTQIMPAVAAIFGLFLGVFMVRTLMKKVTKA